MHSVLRSVVDATKKFIQSSVSSGQGVPSLANAGPEPARFRPANSAAAAVHQSAASAHLGQRPMPRPVAQIFVKILPSLDPRNAGDLLIPCTKPHLIGLL